MDLRSGVVQAVTMPDRLNRRDLSGEEWERLRVLVPSGPQERGGRRAGHRMVIGGVFFGARAGCPRRDLAEGSGNWKTVCDRHRRWSLGGAWEQILDGLRAGCDEAGGRDWTVSAGSAVARARQHAAGARRATAADDRAGGSGG